MGALEDYAKMGGLVGVTWHRFADELAKAREDSNHSLRPVVEAFQRGANVKAARLLCKALSKARQDRSSPLYRAALLFMTMPALQIKLDKAIAFVEEHDLCPLEHTFVEQVVKIYDFGVDAKKHQASLAGGSRGGKKRTANQGPPDADAKLREARNTSIRTSSEATGILAERHGISARRVRQIKTET
jgi:hypothetical protein